MKHQITQIEIAADMVLLALFIVLILLVILFSNPVLDVIVGKGQ